MDIIDRIVEAVKEEWQYQDVLWNPAEDHQHSITEWLVYLEDYIQEAKHICSRKPDPVASVEASHIIRKLATMCFRCMEQNGIEHRDMNDLSKSCELHSIKCKDEEAEKDTEEA